MKINLKVASKILNTNSQQAIPERDPMEDHTHDHKRFVAYFAYGLLAVTFVGMISAGFNSGNDLAGFAMAGGKVKYKDCVEWCDAQCAKNGNMICLYVDGDKPPCGDYSCQYVDSART
ncbi:hypothetical protein J4227_04640 [Candidatus Woesearchaeota archaeon]|nr:hypothetical protein [Candidatus Woesearchaeota archaeon]